MQMILDSNCDCEPQKQKPTGQVCSYAYRFAREDDVSRRKTVMLLYTLQMIVNKMPPSNQTVMNEHCNTLLYFSLCRCDHLMSEL